MFWMAVAILASILSVNRAVRDRRNGDTGESDEDIARGTLIMVVIYILVAMVLNVAIGASWNGKDYYRAYTDAPPEVVVINNRPSYSYTVNGAEYFITLNDAKWGVNRINNRYALLVCDYSEAPKWLTVFSIKGKDCGSTMLVPSVSTGP
jgi:hypothetical protein